MAHIVAKVNGFFADCTFCHGLTPPSRLNEFLTFDEVKNPQQKYIIRKYPHLQALIERTSNSPQNNV
jgi:hypothetical protein